MGKVASKSVKTKSDSKLLLSGIDNAAFCEDPDITLDFLAELLHRDCYQIIGLIMRYLGVVGMTRARWVSSTWNHLVKSYVIRGFSEDQRNCFKWYSRMFDEKRMDLNWFFCGPPGYTSIVHLAAKCGFLELIKTIHKEKMAPYAFNYEKHRHSFSPKANPLYYAAENGHLDIIVWFDQLVSCPSNQPSDLLFCPDIDILPESECQVGYVAGINGHLHILKHLEEHYSKHVKEHLLSYPTNMRLIHKVVQNGHLNVLKWLLDTYPNRYWGINEVHGSSLLRAATENGHHDILDYFYNHHFDKLEKCFNVF